jgi:5'-3' exonuclease
VVTLIVDGNWNLKRNFCKRKDISSKGELCGGIFGFIDSLRSAVNKVLPDRVFVSWDGFNSGKLRYEIYKPYKAKRKEYWKDEEYILSCNENILNEREKEKLEIIKQKLVINQFLDELFIRHLEVKNIEGDDLIAYYVLSSKLPNEKIVIYSKDKDYFQLVDDNVSILNPNTFDFITIDNFKEKVGYTHENALLFKCFEGDSSDEIKGVNGVTINKLIEEFPRIKNEKYKYDRLVEESYDKKVENKKKFYDKIINARDELYRNATLMNLKQPFINEEVKSEMNNIIYGKLSNDRSISNAIKMFFEKGYSKFVEPNYIDVFFLPFYRVINKEKEFNL